jgi:hypothetical protein
MLPFVAHQVLAHSRTKQKTRKPASTKPEERAQAARAERKSVLSRVFDALAASRLRRAEIELAHHKRMRDEIAGK